MTKTILVTGATGNVGAEVVRALLERSQTVRAGIYGDEDAPAHAEAVPFDFTDASTYGPALENTDGLFLLRPPAIAEVERYLFPVVDAAKEAGVGQIVFLSLMGVEKNKQVPHYKVEKYIQEVEVPYTFLRPSFYMQNLNTTYREDIAERDEIFIPAGRGRTSFIDVRDIGDVAGLVMAEDGHLNTAYSLTGDDALNYFEVAEILTEVLGRKITYAKPTQRQYTKRLREEGYPEEYVQVQKMLYTPVRLGLASETTDTMQQLLDRPPTSFRQYAEDYAEAFQPVREST